MIYDIQTLSYPTRGSFEDMGGNCSMILLKNKLKKQKNIRPKPCIFCGHKLDTRSFKEKPVCLSCLKKIINIFHS